MNTSPLAVRVAGPAQIGSQFIGFMEQGDVGGIKNFKGSQILKLTPGQQAQVELQISTDRQLVCKCSTSGSVEAFVKPLLNQGPAGISVCRLNVRAGDVSTRGQIVVELMDGFQKAAELRVDYEVVAGPASPVPVTIQQAPPASQRQSVFKDFGQSYFAPSPIQAVPMQYEVMPSQTQLLENRMFSSNQPNRTMHSEMPQSYLPNQTILDRTALPTQEVEAFQTHSGADIFQSKRPTITQPPAPTDYLYSSNICGQPTQTPLLFQAPEIAPDVHLQPPPTFPRQKTQPMTQSQQQKIDTSKLMHIPAQREVPKQVQQQPLPQKLIRVLPADALFDPWHPQKQSHRKIRVRNVCPEEVSVRCQIVHRRPKNVTGLQAQIDTGEVPSFFIREGQRFTLRPCLDAYADVQAADVLVEFTPNSQALLFTAKLIISVRTQSGAEKLYQVPLLAAGGYHTVDVSLDLQAGTLLISNTGTATAFVKLQSAIVPRGRTATAQSPQGSLRLSEESCVVRPGEQRRIGAQRMGAAVRAAPDEEEIVEAKVGHDTLRLLALGTEGRGDFAQACQVLELKDDVVRVLGQNLEVLRLFVQQ